MFRNVDEYVAAKPEAARRALHEVRSAVRAALPEAQESISYDMPTYSAGKKAILRFAAWKSHVSLYLATPSIVAKFENELRPYAIQKGTIAFPLSSAMPVDLIERIARFALKNR